MATFLMRSRVSATGSAVLSGGASFSRPRTAAPPRHEKTPQIVADGAGQRQTSSEQLHVFCDVQHGACPGSGHLQSEFLTHATQVSVAGSHTRAVLVVQSLFERHPTQTCWDVSQTGFGDTQSEFVRHWNSQTWVATLQVAPFGQSSVVRHSTQK